MTAPSKRKFKHQDWCQYPYCVKCGTPREYHEEGPMTSHGFEQAACACGVVPMPCPDCGSPVDHGHLSEHLSRHCPKKPRPDDPVPAPSVAETLREMAEASWVSDEQIHALEAGARALEWKEEALAVLAKWHALGDALVTIIPLKLGDDIPVRLTELVPAKCGEWRARAEAAEAREAQARAALLRIAQMKRCRDVPTGPTRDLHLYSCPYCVARATLDAAPPQETKT